MIIAEFALVLFMFGTALRKHSLDWDAETQKCQRNRDETRQEATMQLDDILLRHMMMPHRGTGNPN